VLPLPHSCPGTNSGALPAPAVYQELLPWTETHSGVLHAFLGGGPGCVPCSVCPPRCSPQQQGYGAHMTFVIFSKVEGCLRCSLCQGGGLVWKGYFLSNNPVIPLFFLETWLSILMCNFEPFWICLKYCLSYEKIGRCNWNQDYNSTPKPNQPTNQLNFVSGY
jgi:hypothetical protein